MKSTTGTTSSHQQHGPQNNNRHTIPHVPPVVQSSHHRSTNNAGHRQSPTSSIVPVSPKLRLIKDDFVGGPVAGGTTGLFKMKVNPVNLHQELEELEKRIDSQLLFVPEIKDKRFATTSINNESTSSSSSSMVSNLSIIDESFNELLTTVSAHSNKLSEVMKKLWEMNKENYNSLVDNLSLNLKKSQFVIKDKTRQISELLNVTPKSMQAANNSPPVFATNKASSKSATNTRNLIEPVVNYLEELSVRQQLEAEINTKNDELAKLQSVISRIAVWFPNFSTYGGSILSRLLPPLEDPEEAAQLAAFEKEARESFLYDDRKGPVKKNLLLSKTALYFQDSKEKKRPKQQQKDNDDVIEGDEEQDDELDLNSIINNLDDTHGLAADETIKLSQWYLMKDIRRLEHLGIGLKMELNLPDTLERHINPGHTATGHTHPSHLVGGTTGRAVMKSMISLAGGTVEDENTESSADSMSRKSPQMLRRKNKDGGSNSKLVNKRDFEGEIEQLDKTIRHHELQLELAEESMHHLNVQTVLLEKKLKHAEDKFQLSVLETQVLEVDVRNVKKQVKAAYGSWIQERYQLKQEIKVLQASNEKLQQIAQTMMKGSILNTQIMPFLCESESVLPSMKVVQDKELRRITNRLGQRFPFMNEDNDEHIGPSVLPPVQTHNPVELFQILIQASRFAVHNSDGFIVENISGVEATRFSTLIGLHSFIVDKDLFVRDKGVVNNSITLSSESSSELLLLSPAPSGLFADLLAASNSRSQDSGCLSSRLHAVQVLRSVCSQAAAIFTTINGSQSSALLDPLPSVASVNTQFWPLIVIPGPSKGRELGGELRDDIRVEADEDSQEAGFVYGFVDREEEANRARLQNLESILQIRFDDPASSRDGHNAESFCQNDARHQVQHPNRGSSNSVSSIALDDLTHALLLRALCELFGLAQLQDSNVAQAGVPADDMPRSVQSTDIRVAASSWTGVLRREVFFNVYIKMFNCLRHYFLPLKPASSSLVPVDIVVQILPQRIFHVVSYLTHYAPQLIGDSSTTTSTTRNSSSDSKASVSLHTPWWAVLPKSWMETLQLDIYMASKRISLHQHSADVLNNLESIMLTWNTVLRLQRYVDLCLQSLYECMTKLLGLWNAGGILFQNVLFTILQCNVQQTITFSDVNALTGSNDKDSCVIPSAVHPQLSRELQSLDARFGLDKYLLSGLGENAADLQYSEEFAKWRGRYKQQFAALLMHARSPLLVLSFLDVLELDTINIYDDSLGKQKVPISLEELTSPTWIAIMRKGQHLREYLNALLSQLAPSINSNHDIDDKYFHGDEAVLTSTLKRHMFINKVAKQENSADKWTQQQDNHLLRCLEKTGGDNNKETGDMKRLNKATRPSPEQQLIDLCARLLLTTEPLLDNKYHEDGISRPSKCEILIAVKILSAVVTILEQRLRRKDRLLRGVDISEDNPAVVWSTCRAIEHRQTHLKNKYFGFWLKHVGR
jgi:hypothetical protein